MYIYTYTLSVYVYIYVYAYVQIERERKRDRERHTLWGATLSWLLNIIGLFCKRALQKRLYSAKETYNFEEPTNRSHPHTSVFEGGDDGFMIRMILLVNACTRKYVHDVWIYICIYVHIYRKREKRREGDLHICLCIYVYMYIFICMCVYMYSSTCTRPKGFLFRPCTRLRAVWLTSLIALSAGLSGSPSMAPSSFSCWGSQDNQ